MAKFKAGDRATYKNTGQPVKVLEASKDTAAIRVEGTLITREVYQAALQK